MYSAYITKLKNVRPHPNAEKLQLADCFGNTVCVPLDYEEGKLVIYFPCDGQLSEEFCKENDLVRRKDENGNPAGGYLDSDKRNVKTIKLRGEYSDGLALPLSCLAYTGIDLNTLEEGFNFTSINGHEICNKYIPRRNSHSQNGGARGNRVRKKKVPIAPLFAEHADTEQLAYNLHQFKPGDEIEITLKMHGTSGRTAYLPMLKGYKRSILDRIFHREGTPMYDYGYVSGTRRTVLENYDGGYYGNDEFRKIHADKLAGKLHKGETIYYELVGFTTTGATIMADGDNKKLGKEFIQQYGNITRFSYGCELGQSEMYVYRMTLTTDEGYVVEYTPDMVRYRCEQMGLKCVPLFEKFIIPSGLEDCGAYVKTKAEVYYAGADPVGKTHTREGVVVRIVNRPQFQAYKHKNFEFKTLEGLIKETAAAPDMEEAQEVVE